MNAVIPAGYKQTEVGVIPGEWEVKPIGNCLKIRHGKSQHEVVSANGEFPIYGTGGEMGKASRPLYSKPSVLIGRKGTIDAPRYLDIPFWTVDTLFYSEVADSANPKFMFYKFCMIDWYSYNEASGVPSLNARTIEKIFVSSPPLPEQRAIAAALSDVDALLAKLDQLIAKKRNLKQAAMHQLLTGQTRLPGFSGEWEVKRLGDVGECLRGVTYKGDIDLWPHDTANTKRLLRSNNVQDAYVIIENIQFVNADRVSIPQLLKANDILICMANGSKALVGKAGLFDVSDGYDYTFGAFMGCFRTNTGSSSSSFVFYLFQTGRYRNYINNLLAGSSINNLSPSSIESLEFQMPSREEQTAIATLLSDMAAELAALEARRDKTRALKQGMMQELLTGRIRLV